MDSSTFVKQEKQVRRNKTGTKRKKPVDDPTAMMMINRDVNNVVPTNNGSIKMESIDSMDDWKSGEAWSRHNGHIDACSTPELSQNHNDSNSLNSLKPTNPESQLAALISTSSTEPLNGSTTPLDLNSKAPPSTGRPPSNLSAMGPTTQPRPAGPNGARPQSTSGPIHNEGGHFISQQSQIFVFSTGLANEAAEVVQRGQYRSIVEYHMDRPETRQFLQNFPMGNNQHFNARPHSIPNYQPPGSDSIKFDSKDHGSSIPPPMIPPFSESGSALANVELWVQQQNASLQEGPFSPSFGPTTGKQGRNRSGQGNGPTSGSRWLPSPTGRPPPGMPPPGMGPGLDYPDQMPPPGYLSGEQVMMQQRGGPPMMLDENLTPEQLQRREEQLAHLQKIKNMLFPSQGDKRGDFDPRRGPSMYPGGPGRPGPEGMMMRFPHGGGMLLPGPPMMDPHDPMMPPGAIMDPDGFFAGGPGPGLPPNWENMSMEEREWFKLQHEYYLDRQKQQQMQMVRGGPPPAYFGDVGGPRMVGPMSPVSPSFNGPPPHHREHPGFFFQGGPPGSGMNFPPNGPGGPGEFHPDFLGGPMGPGGDPMFSFGPNGGGPRLHPSQMMGHDGMGGPMGPGGPRFPVCKQKRRRNAAVPGPTEKPDDIYRHLQPAPSPQQFCSLNLFEGQELTITRQLNLAYQENCEDQSPSVPGSQPSQQPQQQQLPFPASQLPSLTPTGQPPPAKKKKKSDSLARMVASCDDPQRLIKSEMPRTPDIFSSASSLQSPLATATISTPNLQITTATSTPQQLPTSEDESKSGLNVSKASSGVMNNITSATLASLAKGVESLSDRMQQDMLQGGPFRTVQMPENDSELIDETGGLMPRSQSQNFRMKSPADGGKILQTSEMGEGGVHGEVDRIKFEGHMSNLEGHSSPSVYPPPNNKGNLGPPSAASSILSPRQNLMGNASVQIEASAPNTIQYMPARSMEDTLIQQPQHHPNAPSNMPPYHGLMDFGPGHGPIMRTVDGGLIFDGQMGPGGPHMGPFDGPMMPGDMGPYGFSGQQGPMGGFDGPGVHMFDGPMGPGYNGPLPPGFNGPPPGAYGGPGHPHCFDGPCGPMSEFDGPGYMGGPQMSHGFNGPRHGGPMGFHGPGGGPMGMHNPDLYMGGRMQMMHGDKLMMPGLDGPQLKMEPGTSGKKEKDRKKKKVPTATLR